MKSVLLLYPHQLYPVEDLPKVETVIMVEEPLYFGIDQEYPLKLHKQKLILLRASMRRYVEEVLWPAGYKVDYIDFDVFTQTEDILSRTGKAEQLYVIDPTDDVLTKRLLQARRENADTPNMTFLASPNFYLKEQEVRGYFADHHKPKFADFYQWQRERFNVLIAEDYKPVGGKWAYDDDKPHKLPADLTLPSFGVYGDNQYVVEATAWVEEHFPDNPGSTDFIWPTNHHEARDWLHDFLENRLDSFALYQDTIDARSPWLYHSLLASSMNIGLLKPQEVVQAALKRHIEREVPLASLEVFIRQVLGWREFVRGLYLAKSETMRSANMFDHHRKLTSAWYKGTTGLPPLDDLIKKLNQHAYAHNNEGMMIASNLMVLAEIQPEQIRHWFSELFIDAYDWTVLPNVYDSSQFADSNLLSKAYISPSNYVLDISHYERGVWSDVWDGLFWRFIEKHETVLHKNARMRVMIQRFHSMDADRKRIIHYRAEDFLNQHTTL